MTYHTKTFLVFTLALAALSAAPLFAAGSTLSDYHNRLKAARNDVESIIGALQKDRDLTTVDRGLIRKAAARVRKAIPANESMEVRGTTVETQNRWVQIELDKFENAVGQADEVRILSGISERLSSVEKEVDELEKATAGVRTKDEDKRKLNEILSREEFQKPEDKGQSAFQRWMTWFIDWLRSLFPDRPVLPNVDPNRFQPLSVIIQVIVYGLVIGLIGFLIYKFAPVIVERFSRREKKERTGRVILGEHIDASRSASDLFAEAENYARHGDLRAAIRKGYVALLCDLADKKVIGLARHKTNRDYLRDVRKRTSIFGPMKRATGSFERHWYGFTTPEAKDWVEFRDQYRSAVNSQTS